MANTIPIPESTANTIKDLLKKDLADKLEKLKVIELECKKLDFLIKQLNPSPPFEQSDSETHTHDISALATELGYKDTWTWEKKIKFVMDYRANIGLTTTEIVATLLEFEPSLIGERAKAVGSISAIISSKSKDGKVFYKKVNDRNENVYYISPF